MAKALPFIVQPKTDIRAIGSPEYGVIHLLKKGSISPRENPIDLQEAGTRQAKVQLMLQQAIKRLAKEEGVSNSEARKRLFAAPVKDAESGQETDDSASLYDHLSSTEAAELLNLREDTAATALKAATLFIRYRVAYPVQIVSNAQFGVPELTVAPLSFPIADGQKIQFGGIKVQVNGFHEVGAETIAVAAIPQPIADGKIGYLCNFETGKQQIGDPEWTEDDTAELPEPLILAIYRFYELEMAGLEEEPQQEQQDAEGKEPAQLSSADLPSESRSTGENSSSDSPISEQPALISA